LRSNQGREDSVNCRLVDDLVDLLLLRVSFFLTEVLVVIGELVHGSAKEAY